MTATAWSILPPIITIVLALWTKEVYMSLIIGIFSGAMLFAGGNFLQATLTMFHVMADKIGSNVNILVFLVILGILVAAITRSGAMNAYGEWATRTIRGKRSASLVTVLLGIVIFIDDYFNCLTVGTVMRPVTDKFQIARTKLAYIIDATAAPICIIAPVSSWAAAVGSSLPEDAPIDGFMLFLQTIPFNLYAWLTILFMLFVIWTGRDFGAMRRSVEKSNAHFEIPKEYQDTAEASASAASEGRGKMIDLVLPLLVLIAACVYGMLYTGGIHEGASIADAFANCDSSKSLVLGSFIAFVFTGLLYLPRRVVSFNVFCDSFGWGFKAMTPAIFILCLAWTLSGICSKEYLDLGGSPLPPARAGARSAFSFRLPLPCSDRRRPTFSSSPSPRFSQALSAVTMPRRSPTRPSSPRRAHSATISTTCRHSCPTLPSLPPAPSSATSPTGSRATATSASASALPPLRSSWRCSRHG